jgi:predicted nuclease of restriction endonuclease-like (RecB) superfamily
VVLSTAPERNSAGEDQQQQYITDPFSRQTGHYKTTNPQLSKENFQEKEKLVAGPSTSTLTLTAVSQLLDRESESERRNFKTKRAL